MRGPRITYPNAVFHIINRFVDKHPFFKTDEDYKTFLNIYYEIAKYYQIKTFSYCIMPTHFHYVIQTITGEISKFLQRFLTTSAQTLNRKYERTGHLFQGRTKTLIVQTELYFETVVKYVLLNPVKAKIVKNIFEYPYSSANDLLNLNEEKICLPKLWEYIFKEKYIKNEANKIRIKEWLNNLEAEKIYENFQKNHRGSFLATKEYREELLKKKERRKIEVISEENINRKSDKVERNISWEEIKHKTEEAIKEYKIIPLWKNKRIAFEQISWYIAHNYACWGYRKIKREAKLVGINESRISMAIKRIKNKEEKKKIVEEIIKTIF